MKSYSGNVFICLCVLAGSSFSQQNSYRFSIEPLDDHLVVSIQTSEPLPCVGSLIRNQVQWDADTTVVIMSGFVRPIPCVQGLESASARIVLKHGSKKTFYLKFREETYSDIWKISLGQDSLQATPIHHSFTSYSK